MGAHILAIKDMAGLCKPYAAEKLVKALREEVGIPIHFHTHDTSGMNAAVDAEGGRGRRARRGWRDRFHERHDQPAQSELHRRGAARTPSATRASIWTRSISAPIIGRRCATCYAPFDTGPKAGTAEVYLHEMPGGQYTNLKEQAESMGLGARWHEIARTYAEVNLAFGDIVKVTPSSKVVGDMAIFLVSHDMTMEQFERLAPDHNLTLPEFRRRDVRRVAGRARGRLAEEAAERSFCAARSRSAAGRARTCPKWIWRRPPRTSKRRSASKPPDDEVLSYLMYPEVFLKFAKARAGLRRRRSPAHAAIFLRHGARPGDRRRTGAGQNAGHQVAHRGRAASRRHAHGLLRTERPAARSDRPRPQAWK